MTNAEIRAWYQQEVARIAALNRAWVEQGLSLGTRARRAWRIRRDARLRARSMMENPDEVEMLRSRDRELYGDPNGPTFGRLLGDLQLGGASTDEAYEQIIQGAHDK
jgi:hypothetical protein